MSKKTITLKIQTTRGSETFTFDETDKVSKVISDVVEKFGYQADGNYTLVFEKTELSPERPLISYHLPDNAVLNLTDTGGGV